MTHVLCFVIGCVVGAVVWARLRRWLLHRAGMKVIRDFWLKVDGGAKWSPDVSDIFPPPAPPTVPDRVDKEWPVHGWHA
jgi:hypothetical protein